MPGPDYLTTREVADLIRLRSARSDLVATGAIPHVRVTGGCCSRALVDAWLARHAGYRDGVDAAAAPGICAGSHDPLLDWALREARHRALPWLAAASRGLDALAGGRAQMAGMHLVDGSDAWNVEHVKRALPGQRWC
jgi:hypothetical protein